MGYDHSEGAGYPDSDEEREYDKEMVASVSNNPLVRLLTPASKVRILMVLIDLDGHDTNPTDLCEMADISRNAWYDNRDDLLAAGVIEESRATGNAPMYRAMMDDPLVERLEEVYDIAAARQRERDRHDSGE